MASNVMINPKWIAYNDLQNEGGEGYNPHPKWIPRAAQTIAAKPAATSAKMLRDPRGNLIPADKLAAQLAADEAKIGSLTNEYAIKITQAAIDHARSQLGL